MPFVINRRLSPPTFSIFLSTFSILFILTYWINIKVISVQLFVLLYFICTGFIVKANKFHFGKSELILAGYVIFSTIPSFNDSSLMPYTKVALYPFIIFFVFSNLNYSPGFVKKIVLSIYLSTLIIIFFMYFQENFLDFNFSIDYALHLERWQGYWFIDPESRVGPTAIATIIAVNILVMFSLILSSKNFYALKIILLLLGFFFLVMASGRTSMVAVFFAILSVTSFHHEGKKGYHKKIIWIFVSIIVVFFIIFILTSILSDFLPKNYFDRMSFFWGDAKDDSLSNRFKYWQTAWQIISQNIFGCGFEYFFKIYGRTPHNEFIGQFVGGGVFTLFFYILFHFYMLIQFLSNRKAVFQISRLFAYYIIGLFFIIFITSLTENYSISSGNIFYPIIWLSLGVLNAVSKNRA